jgi:hypothetical protein
MGNVNETNGECGLDGRNWASDDLLELPELQNSTRIRVYESYDLVEVIEFCLDHLYLETLFNKSMSRSNLNIPLGD